MAVNLSRSVFLFPFLFSKSHLPFPCLLPFPFFIFLLLFSFTLSFSSNITTFLSFMQTTCLHYLFEFAFFPQPLHTLPCFFPQTFLIIIVPFFPFKVPFFFLSFSPLFCSIIPCILHVVLMFESPNVMPNVRNKTKYYQAKSLPSHLL